MKDQSFIVLIDSPLPREHADAIRKLSPRIEVIEKATPESLARADVLYMNSTTADKATAPRLKFAQVDTAAINHLMALPLAKSGIPVANVRGAYTISVAEFSIGMILTLTRRLHRCRDMQVSGKWLPDSDYPAVQGDSLHGKTLGIVGYGAIGRHVARIAQAMGMTVLACKKNPRQHREEGFQIANVGDPEGKIPLAWFGIDKVTVMLGQCDALLVTLPKTPATTGLIGKREIESLPKPPRNTFFVNIGRGGVVDEAALADALRSGRITGAGLDVFANEPLEPASPFWKLPSAIIAPHIASYTKDQQARAGDVLVENIKRHLAGKPLVNLVSFEEGY